MSFRGHCLLICLLIALAPAAFAQTGSAEQVYATAVSNKIFKIDFTNGTATVVVDDPGANFQGLAVRNDLRLVAIDFNNAGHVKIFNTNGAGATLGRIPVPGGVTLDPDGNIYVSNRHPDRADKVWKLLRNPAVCLDDVDPTTCVNGGYHPPVPVDAEIVIPKTDTPTFRLADTKFFNGLLYVLVENPAYLLSYADAHLCTGDCVPQVVTSAFQGLTPSSLAFTADEILVGTLEGRILRFGLDGTPIPEPFATISGKVGRIAVGLQQGTPFAFLTVGNTVQKYGFVNRLGVLLATVEGLSSPVGVNLASAGSASVSPTNTKATLTTLTAEFETVSVGGLVHLDCTSFEDPREQGCPGGQCTPVNEPLATDLALNDPSLPAHVRDLGFPNVIPAYVRAARTKRPADIDTPSGPPTFRLCVAARSRELAFTGPIALDALIPREGSWLGHNPSCTDPDPTQRPRFFYSEEPPHPPIYEGRRFVDLTSHCNRDGADSWEFGSLFLTGARNTLFQDGPGPALSSQGCTESECPPRLAGCMTTGIMDCQFKNCNAVLNLPDDITCVLALAPFKTTLATAIAQFDLPLYCVAKDTMLSLLRALEDVILPSSCPATLQAELRARTEAILFQLGQPGLCPGLRR